MNKSFARKLHRSIALFVAAGLLLLTLTGVLLNHSKALQLNDIKIQQPWLLQWYGLSPVEPTQSYQFKQNWLSQLDQQLYWNQIKIRLQGDIQQVAKFQSFIFVQLNNKVAFLTDNGEFVDYIQVPFNLESFNKATFISKNQRLYLKVDQQIWQLNHDLTAFNTLNNPSADFFNNTTLQINKPIRPLPNDLILQLIKQHPSKLSLEKLLLELHNGYFLGSLGPWLLDLFALITMLSIITGYRLHRKH
ncbi:MAG: hypothetical protein ISEC1_P1415 [Thiomicrorhabdus sp.]|nr:MAG: hypothetical protein ISEC1_P1415 [Thiomicrorhabdus sp.]